MRSRSSGQDWASLSRLRDRLPIRLWSDPSSKSATSPQLAASGERWEASRRSCWTPTSSRGRSELDAGAGMGLVRLQLQS